MQRTVTRIITAHTQREGDGSLIVRRPFPRAGLEHLDPFLLLDEAGPMTHAPGKAGGAPDHPHRGFETVSYVLQGELEHEDSRGGRGSLSAGDVQWMTAGSGVVHSEMPSRRFREEGGTIHGFQVWVNLPAKLKFTEPRYQDVRAATLPTATTADGLAEVRVIAGRALGIEAQVKTHLPIGYLDWSLKPGASVTHSIDPQFTGLVYVFEGTALVGEAGQPINAGQLAVLSDGEAVRLRAEVNVRLLLLSGPKLNEPVARYGPFVMNTEEELEQAVLDYQAGKFGRITR